MTLTGISLQECFKYTATIISTLIIVKLLLGCFPNIKQRSIAFVINFICTRVHRTLKNRKTALFSDLDKLKNERSAAAKDEPFSILEIGIGGGSNFAFYPENSCVVGVDPNDFFEKYVREKLVSNPKIIFKEFIKGSAEDLSFIPNSTIDAVVCTFVLCSVRDVDASLNEIKRILKPGGKFLFIEHVSAEHGSWLCMIQRAVQPFWGYMSDGCHVDRNTGDYIKRAQFRRVNIESFFLHKSWKTLPLIRPHIMGVATK